MANRKRSTERPQAKHKKSRKSQHDKRDRLGRANPDRKKTTNATIPLTGPLQGMVLVLQSVMDPRTAFRLSIIIAGMLLGDDRRTASAWFVVGGVQDDWDRFYDCLQSVGRISGKLATALLGLVVFKLGPTLGDRILLGLDDSPTRRYGRQVEGAGVHHNPTPGPADGEWIFGHNWVCLAWLAPHALWGVIALPLRSLLYVREMDVPKLQDKYGNWEFRTKHALGVELLKWFVSALRLYGIGTAVWLAVDGAYAARPFLLPVMELGVVVVSRLRKDACLYDVPPADSHGNRIYGTSRLSLAKRAGSRHGWSTITYWCRGKQVTRDYKTFVATSKLVSGPIRVVIIRFEDGGWAPYFCTDTSATVDGILAAAGARWAIEEHFHDVKEIWGAGQQQVRNVWSSIGCWNLNQWVFTLVELCCWDRSKSELVDRRARSWDNPDRRPSHADRRRTIAQEMLRKPILAALPKPLNNPHFMTLLDHVFALAA